MSNKDPAENDRDILIHPRRGRGEPMLPASCLLVPNPAEAKKAHRFLGLRQGRQGSLYHSRLTLNREGTRCVAGPALGAAAAGLVLEKLIVRGVSECIVMSCCGSFEPRLSIGDVLVPAACLSGEGVSQYYGGKDQLTVDAGLVRHLQQRLTEQQIASQTGIIWSTDAPYRERKSLLTQLHQRHGVGAVDMEFSALCAIAALRGIRLAGVFIVSDELWAEHWQPGFSNGKFLQKSHAVFKTLVATIE